MMSKKICILNYGLGNIWSLKSAIKFIGYDTNFFSEMDKKEKFDFLIIPGVGSFSKASQLLLDSKNLEVIKLARKNNIPILGICLGMQVMMSNGDEDGHHDGLNLLEGNVSKIENYPNEKLPNIGWKKVQFKNLGEMNFLEKYNFEKFYFIHSYHVLAKDKDKVIGVSKYYDKEIICALKSEKNIIGFQFHPEKSGQIGLSLLSDVFKHYL